MATRILPTRNEANKFMNSGKQMEPALARKLLLLGTFLSAACLGDAAAAQSNEDMLKELRAMRAKIDAQSAELDALRAKVEAQAEVLAQSETIAKAKVEKTAAAEPVSKAAGPVFKGAPEFRDGDWSFKVRGRMMYDVGYTQNPNDAIATKNLGFNSRIRRARLGAEGYLPGNFAYRVELDFASNAVELADAVLEWEPAHGLKLRAGNHNTFQSLAQASSSVNDSFMERAQFVDAYSQNRRLGGSATWFKDNLFIGAGLFNEGVNGNYNNDGWLIGGRAVFMPQLDDVQLHLGANFQHREANTAAQGVRYAARPNPRLSDVRFADTSTIAANKDDQIGLEAFAIWGPLYFGGEASWLKVNAITPADLGPGDVIPPGAVIASGDPRFFGYYLEGGYFFTGETRGYQRPLAQWGRAKVANPLGKGGFGALSGNVRWDVLDLSDKAIQSGGINTSSSRGGRSRALSASLVWQPIDYVRITGQYTLMNVKGGPFALQVNGLTTGDANDYDYKVNIFGTRFAYDF